ncbi:NAD(P)/FAD-dependent oxidoreductase [Brevundimonas albigilva]|uniref:NAD(P)/FAD-dependent oxidoreductase n=2 Tax=Brevundimonas albigilva TaxID=1312364 RepID=A0ABY4STH7_9CAUL|nr:NAD(P)/FAD-dependent oxidoreductase [Brevundimonas albigilva]URI16957.1 NAD(P)/FAD-dependent oxidoreductase [Brevundimonas albigilva]
MMCAVEAGRRGRRVLVVDHAARPGEKIRISGGGRCNFTNLGCGPANFLGENPRFATSALRRFTQHDFIKRVDRAGIAWHEKTQNGRSLGQLFCDGSAKQIVALLTDDMAEAGVDLRLKTGVDRLSRSGDGWSVGLSDGSEVAAASLVVATGGKSIPKMGATGWAYDVARRFDIRVTETRPALVPLTFEAGLLETLAPLAGVAVDARIASAPADKGRKARFDEAMLFTHRGLSGPVVLQISSYWREGEAIVAAMAPELDVFETLKAARADNGRQAAHNALAHIVPRRLAEYVCAREGVSGNLADASDKALRRLDQAINAWSVKPVGSEGYRTAEVTLGGIDTAALDQQTMQARSVPGLYFIGEAVDVTGWLGGYNFQWAWSSGWAAGQAC